MPHPFRFAITTTGTPSRDAWLDLARRAESLGYSALLMPDRPSLGGLASFSALATAAAATTTLRVGSYVFSNGYRHPVILAREAATLDLLSNGRFELGIGAGVSQPEFDRLGIPFDPPGPRISRLQEAIHIIKLLFTQERVTFSGTYYNVTDMPGLPKPVQQPHPPIIIGSAGKRMLTFAAREAQTIAPTLKWPRPGVDPADATLDEKIDWIREAAGDRISEIELAQTRYDIEITDSPSPLGNQPGAPPLPKQKMSVEQTIAQLQEQRDRYGFSYIQLYETQQDNFAPIVARLAGE